MHDADCGKVTHGPYGRYAVSMISDLNCSQPCVRRTKQKRICEILLSSADMVKEHLLYQGVVMGGIQLVFAISIANQHEYLT